MKFMKKVVVYLCMDYQTSLDIVKKLITQPVTELLESC